MAKVKWTPKAKKHLRSIFDYIAKDSETYAGRFIERLVMYAENLSEFPEMGREVPELKGYNLRELIFQNYRIVYRYLRKKQEVNILSVVHCAREMSNLPRSEWK
ncbi:MAG: type II toxin-antitoxin system RelE/ParE family toxin [Bacillota bacterium]